MDPVPKASAKGKRDINVPRITYHAGSRTFDRLFKEQSLHETEDVVRKKLGLPEDCEFRLAQLRGKHVVDLEDDDDFDAFHAIAHEQMAVEVLVIIEGDDDRPTTSERTAIKSISR
ncbi:hypothetical protein GYMLUDRAFT_861788 [Collybiopsis luxurians FD-317 M1]|nr:hypothetical protein GYMLUDRAFT_861788 [Collybiopsis luxurians FD-317 M1]